MGGSRAQTSVGLASEGMQGRLNEQAVQRAGRRWQLSPAGANISACRRPNQRPRKEEKMLTTPAGPRPRADPRAPRAHSRERHRVPRRRAGCAPRHPWGATVRSPQLLPHGGLQRSPAWRAEARDPIPGPRTGCGAGCPRRPPFPPAQPGPSPGQRRIRGRPVPSGGDRSPSAGRRSVATETGRSAPRRRSSDASGFSEPRAAGPRDGEGRGGRAAPTRVLRSRATGRAGGAGRAGKAHGCPSPIPP